MPPDPDAPAKQQQLKLYEEALKLFQQQKFHRAHEVLERVVEGPSKELGDRAKVHLRICEQRISRLPAPTAKSAEDHYTQGVTLMNLGRWDEAREHLDRARKAAPKAAPSVVFTVTSSASNTDARICRHNAPFVPPPDARTWVIFPKPAF